VKTKVGKPVYTSCFLVQCCNFRQHRRWQQLIALFERMINQAKTKWGHVLNLAIVFQDRMAALFKLPKTLARSLDLEIENADQNLS